MATTETAPRDLTVGQRIRWARKRKALSQETLAKALGTTRQVVIRWERDKHLPNSLSRERLSEALGQEPDFFGDWEAALADPFRGSDGEPAPRGARRTDAGAEGMKAA